MSDWDDDMYDDEEEEELSFEDEDDEMNDDDDHNNNDNGNCVDGNNKTNFELLYFKAKYLKEEDKFDEAIDVFSSIIIQTDQSSVYIFKSMKQLIKIYEHQKNLDKIIEILDRLFLMKDTNQVDNMYFNSSISKIVQRIDNKNYDDSFSSIIFNKFYDYLSKLSLDELDSSNQKLKTKLELIMSNNLIKNNDLDLASQVLNNLEINISKSNESLRNTFYLDVIANKILILINDNTPKNLKELKRLSILANSLISGIPQTKILGIINEGSGLVAMYSNDFKKANTYFQNSFKNFNDSGDNRRNDVLVKFIITSILSKSEVNPFQSSDFQGFLKDETVNLLMEVYNAVQNLNVKEFNKLVKSPSFSELLEAHKFIKDFVSEISECIYFEFIINMIPLFEKVKFEYFTKRLGITMIEFKRIFLKLYGKGLINNCKIDYVDNCIISKETTKFIDITFDQFVEKSFKFYDLSKSTNIENFKNQARNIKKRNSKDVFGSADDDGDVQVVDEEESSEQLHSNEIESDISMFSKGSHFFEQSNVGSTEIDVTSVNRNLLHQDIRDMMFDTVFNTPNLSSLTHIFHGDGIFQKDSAKSIQTRSHLQEYVQQYLVLLETSVPYPVSQNLSYLSQVKDSQTNTEFHKLFPSKAAPPPTSSTNIPDTLQQSTMNPLVPTNPDAVPPTAIGAHQRLLAISHALTTFAHKKNTALVRRPNFTGWVPRKPLAPRHRFPFSHQRAHEFPPRPRLFHNPPSETETTSLENENFSVDENETY